MARDSEGKWKPGTSGNPGGRPKDSKFAELIREIGEQQEQGSTKFERLVNKVYDLALKGDMAAVRWIADRIEGRPRQSIALEPFNDKPIRVFDRDSKELEE